MELLLIKIASTITIIMRSCGRQIKMTPMTDLSIFPYVAVGDNTYQDKSHSLCYVTINN